MLRPGHLGQSIGPIIAENNQIAYEIAAKLIASSTTDVLYWDAVTQNAVQLASDFGFEPIRDLVRMRSGHQCQSGNLNKQYAIADLATG